MSPRGPIPETERAEHPVACLSESRLGRLRSPPSGADKRGRSAPGKGTAVYGVLWGKSTGSP